MSLEYLVQLLDHMGSDLTVVNAARVSLHKESIELTEKDKKLIKYLATHGHWTPFAQPQLQFRISMPIFVARQWYKHQIGFTRNEVSRRYVDEDPIIWAPEVWRKRPTGGIKQGSGEEFSEEENLDIDEIYGLAIDTAEEMYTALIERDVAPEMARAVLPMGTYTEFIETGSLAAYARLYGLRSKPDAQKEIRDYALEIGRQIEPLFPVSWAVLTNENS